jgi:alpha-tubulin suppressor-like RCC1 family protein
MSRYSGCCPSRCALLTITTAFAFVGCDDSSVARCGDECPSASATSCNGGELRTCVENTSGCLAWSSPIACASASCADDQTCDFARIVAAGSSHTCALLAPGHAMCWGAGRIGQLGDGGTTPTQSTPVDVVGLSTALTSIDAGDSHTCALLEAGALKCWGNDVAGQLGDGGLNTDQATPVDVVNYSSSPVAVALGSAHTCAVLATGGLRCWGDDSFGQLGDGSLNMNQSEPADVVNLWSKVLSVAAGGGNTCAVLATGGLKCWGDDFSGQLGDGGSNADQNKPVDVSGLTSGVIAVTVGDFHACALLDYGGVKCWGNNARGQLGDGLGSDRATPGDVVGLTEGVLAISAGSAHACALLSTGAVHCWGANDQGQIGHGTVGGDEPTPVAVNGLNRAALSISAGGRHTCATVVGGGIKCWGSNGFGQLGTGGTSPYQEAPVDVQGL